MQRGMGRLWSNIANFIRYSNLRLIAICISASIFGCLLVYSYSVGVDIGWQGIKMQVIATVLGVIVALFVSRVDYEDICSLWPIWSGISILLMLLTFTPLGLNVAGTDDTAWLQFGPVTFQPSELMKISFIISFSLHLSKVQDNIRQFKVLFFLCLHGGIHILLVFLQGDDGTALVFLCVFLTMLLVSGVNLFYYVIGISGVCAAIPILWNYFLSDDKKARILCIFPSYVEQYIGHYGTNPAQWQGWQQYMGLTAIGSGQLTGVGLFQGHNPELPERNNDFIFTIAAEEFGFLGGMLVFLLLCLLVYELFRCANKSQDSLGSYICIGLMALIGFQSLINLGMNLRVLPVIGITLPFFSDGGSSVLTLYLGIGLALSVSFSERTRKGNTLSRL